MKKNRKTFQTVILILLILNLSQFFNLFFMVEASDGWLSGWTYRKSHEINYTSGAGTNYQKRIKTNFGFGVDNDENVYLNNHSRQDFGDVRFTDNDKVTLLDCWMESKTDGNNAIFWVEVADDLSVENVIIYVYYGKSDAIYPYLSSEETHGEATFWYFHNFETDTVGQTPSKFLDTTNLQVYADGGQGGKALRSTGDNHPPPQRMNMTNIAGLCLNGKIKYNSGIYIRHLYGVRHVDSNNYIYVGDISTNNYLDIYECIAGIHYQRAYIGFTWGITWHNIEIRVYEDNIYVILDTTNLSYLTLGLTSAGKCSVGTWANCLSAWDFIRVRKFVDPEPAHGIWGSEEMYSLPSLPSYSVQVRNNPYFWVCFIMVIVISITVIFSFLIKRKTHI